MRGFPLPWGASTLSRASPFQQVSIGSEVADHPTLHRPGQSSPYPLASRSASVSAVIASLRLRSLGHPVTRHRWSRRTAATTSAPLITSDMDSSLILIDMG